MYFLKSIEIVSYSFRVFIGKLDPVVTCDFDCLFLVSE